MTGLARQIYRTMVAFGFDPRKTLRAIRGVPAFVRDYRQFRRQMKSDGESMPITEWFPCLDDRYASSGATEGHYFRQDLLVAQRIFANNPHTHVDVGSRIDGFVAHVASFRPVTVLDIRPPPQPIPNITFIQADLMKPLPPELVGCCDSLSCLHAIEHFGLGRYGDPINVHGHENGIDNIRALVKSQGKIYISAPIGQHAVAFNAHRTFAVQPLVDVLSHHFHLDSISYIDDSGSLFTNINLGEETPKIAKCLFGCAIFEMTKPQ